MALSYSVVNVNMWSTRPVYGTHRGACFCYKFGSGSSLGIVVKRGCLGERREAGGGAGSEFCSRVPHPRHPPMAQESLPALPGLPWGRVRGSALAFSGPRPEGSVTLADYEVLRAHFGRLLNRGGAASGLAVHDQVASTGGSSRAGAGDGLACHPLTVASA